MMTATACPSLEQLRALSLGQLPDQQSDDLFYHVRDCDSCRAELETVSDQEDSFIADLRRSGDWSQFESEAGYPIAIAKALQVHPFATGSASKTTDSCESLPRMIGEYHLIRPLGRGGMGCVFLAQQPKLDRQVALKIIVGHRLADARTRERFDAEMRAVGRLSHPNIVAAHDAREIDGTAVLVTEFIDGFDLSELVHRMGPLAITEACELARRVAVALQFTSSQGFVHRDVKPSNIMLSRAGEVKLLDLGLARFQQEQNESASMTASGQTMGTADYIAPEQIADSRAVDVRADIYALGCTLFKLLTGAAPFADAEHNTAFAKMTAHVSQQPPSLTEFLPDAPVALADLLSSMLAKSPSNRPSQPKEVAEQLSVFAHGCDLQELAERVASLPPEPNVPLPPKSRCSHSKTLQPSPQSYWKRPVSKFVAVAAGFLGALAGLCCGIILTITNPDGTKSVMQLATGSQVQIVESEPAPLVGRKPGPEPSKPEPPTSVAANQPPPLQFGLPVHRLGSQLEPRIDDATLREMTEKLHRSSSDRVVQKYQFQFVSIPPGDEANYPIVVWNNGWPFTLVSTDARYAIGWDEIAGHLVDLKTLRVKQGRSVVGVKFDSLLSQKLRQLTERATDQRLRLIVDNRALESPNNVAEIDAWVVIPEGLSAAQRQLLQLGLAREQTASAIAGNTANAKQQHLSPLDLQGRSLHNLQQVGAAVQAFTRAFDTLPGSTNMIRNWGQTSATEASYPCSWRVGLLPYLGQAELYRQYHFDEPWDSAHNSTLLEKMPAIYRSPYAAADQPAGNTNILGFTGEHSALSDNGLALEDLADGASSTLLFVETKAYLPWTKPEDLSFADDADAKRAIPFENGELNYLTADGVPHSLLKPLKWELLGQLITRKSTAVSQSTEFTQKGMEHQGAKRLSHVQKLLSAFRFVLKEIGKQQVVPSDLDVESALHAPEFAAQDLEVQRDLQLIFSKSWPLPSLKFVSKGLDGELSNREETVGNAYTLYFSPTEMMHDFRGLFGTLGGKASVFDEFVESLHKDLNGPRIRLQQDLIDQLTGQVLVVFSESDSNAEGIPFVAFETTGPTAVLETTLQKLIANDPRLNGPGAQRHGVPHFAGRYLVFDNSWTVKIEGDGAPVECVVRGVVTMNGKPLPDTGILFLPQVGQKILSGKTDAQGKYLFLARRVVPGTYRVKISNRTEGYRDKEGNWIAGNLGTVPSRYNTHSNITVEIQAGNNPIHFSLSSD